jgi:hypothetical protein
MTDKGDCDNIRRQALTYCHESAVTILLSDGLVKSKLFQVKYLDRIEKLVAETEKFRCWKSI